jgi:hypothetical protein
MKLISHIPLLPKLSMRGAVRPFPEYVFMAWCSMKQKMRLNDNWGSSFSTKVYPKVSGLTSCRENCKWCGSLPLGAVVSLFCWSSEFCRHNPLCCFSTSVYCSKRIFRYDSVWKLLDTPSLVTELRTGQHGFDSRQRPGFFLRHLVQTGSGAHPATHGYGSFLGLKRPGREADHLFPLPRLRMHGAVPLLTHTSAYQVFISYLSMVWSALPLPYKGIPGIYILSYFYPQAWSSCAYPLEICHWGALIIIDRKMF